MKSKKILVIGMGVTGAVAARDLTNAGHSVSIVTNGKGLLETFGNSYEKGGHVYSPGAQASMFENGIEIKGIPFTRKAFYYDKDGRWDYPVQSSMPGVVHKVVSHTGQSLGAYAREAFGEDFYNSWYRKFNFRVWGTDPDKMSSHWVFNRVPNLAKRQDWGPNNTFRYMLGDDIMAKILNGVKVQEIVADNLVKLTYDDGRIQAFCGTRQSAYFIGKFDHVISTIPLSNLIDCAPDAIQYIAGDLGSTLRYNVVTTFGVTLSVPYKQDWSWSYGDVDRDVHRVTNLGLYQGSRFGKFIFEVPSPSEPYKKLPSQIQSLLPIHNIPKGILDAMTELEIPIKCISTAHMCSHLGYPIPMLGAKEQVRNFKINIIDYGFITAGRWGSHAYLNVDAAVRDGVAAAKMVTDPTFSNIMKYVNVGEEPV